MNDPSSWFHHMKFFCFYHTWSSLLLFLSSSTSPLLVSKPNNKCLYCHLAQRKICWKHVGGVFNARLVLRQDIVNYLSVVQSHRCQVFIIHLFGAFEDLLPYFDLASSLQHLDSCCLFKLVLSVSEILGSNQSNFILSVWFLINRGKYVYKHGKEKQYDYISMNLNFYRFLVAHKKYIILKQFKSQI